MLTAVLTYRLGKLKWGADTDRTDHEIDMANWSEFQSGMERDIENFSKIGDAVKVGDLTLELANHRARWREAGWKEIARSWKK